jgi:hypothetical protein
MNRQRGQSMTEFAIGMVAVALLLLGSITIAGLQKVQRRMAIAARQAAFQGAWMAPAADRAALLQPATGALFDDPGLTDAVGRDPYIRPADVVVTAAMSAPPGMARTATQVLIAPLQLAGGFLGGEFDLTSNGLLSGMISVEIKPTAYRPEPFDVLTVPLHQPFVLLTDAWNAGGTAQVRSRTAGLVPTSALSRMQTLWQPLLAPLSLIEPSLSRLCLGIIEPDRVPEDRLGAGRSPLPGRCP